MCETKIGSVRIPLFIKVPYAFTISKTETSLDPNPTEGTDWSLLSIPHFCATSTTLSQPTVSVTCAVIVLSERAIAHRNDISRSEEHTSELQSRENLVCRLLLE